MVAIQRLPRLLVGPWYLTTAEAVLPDTWEPVQWNWGDSMLAMGCGFVMVWGA
jgi:hypothetical protein